MYLFRIFLIGFIALSIHLIATEDHFDGIYYDEDGANGYGYEPGWYYHHRYYSDVDCNCSCVEGYNYTHPHFYYDPNFAGNFYHTPGYPSASQSFNLGY